MRAARRDPADEAGQGTSTRAEPRCGRRRRLRSWPTIRPTWSCFPKPRLTGYFLEGAVYDLALRARRFGRATLPRTWRDACDRPRRHRRRLLRERRRHVLQQRDLPARRCADRERIVHVHRKMFLADLRRLRRRALSFARTRYRRLRNAVRARWRCWSARTRGTRSCRRLPPIKGARILIVPSASPGRGIEGERRTRKHRAVARDAALDRRRARRLRDLRRAHGFRRRQGNDRVVLRHRSARQRARPGARCWKPASCAPISTCARSISRARACRCSATLRAVLPDLLLDDELPLPREPP